MNVRARLILLFALFGIGCWLRPAYAEGEGSDDQHEAGSGSAEQHHEGSAEHHEGSGSGEEHHDGSAAEHHDGAEHHEGSGSAEEHHDGSAAEHHDAGEHHLAQPAAHEAGISDADASMDTDGDGIADIEEVSPDEDADEDDPALKVFDADGDGVVEPNEVADNKEFDSELKELGIGNDVADVDAEHRPAGSALIPTISVAQFQKLVNIARKVVLGKMAVKAQRKADKKMKTFSMIVVGFSLLGILLLLMPVALRKKYPGQGGVLFKYSALAALTFVVTVNLFGGVLYGMRTVQGHLSGLTNPSVALASGTFDTLHDDAEEYLAMGKELFAPTIKQMRELPHKQPVEILLENGQKVMKTGKLFLSIKGMIKKVDFVFGIIPIVLTLLTLILFVLAIRPTLMEIIKMPAQVAAGNAAAAGDAVKKSIARVIGELKATVCTIGILTVLTLLSAFVLGKTVVPALAAFLEYFAKSVNYLLFVEGSSSGLVFIALFAVILFLVLNLASLILSMAFYIGKSQKCFQQRFNEGRPLSDHAQFFKWGTASVVLIQVFPMLFAFIVRKLLNAVNDTSGITDPAQIGWTKTLLLGPGLLIVAFLVLFWAVRGLKGLTFLAKYKVKVKAPPSVAGERPAA